MAELGSVLQREIRAPDFVSRYGGDEFALVLPETDLDGARASISRVRRRIDEHPFPDLAAGERPQLSAGIVTFPHPRPRGTADLFPRHGEGGPDRHWIGTAGGGGSSGIPFFASGRRAAEPPSRRAAEAAEPPSRRPRRGDPPASPD
jgi:hypothetical protein